MNEKKDLKGTQSEENLKAAFAGESQARNRYTYYAKAARAAGDDEIADLFEKMAVNETFHAKIWFEFLYETGDSPFNLTEAIKGEHFEWTSMYPDFARQARKDGLEDLAAMFEKVAEIEQNHEKQFMMALVNLAKKEKPGTAPKQKAEAAPASPAKALTSKDVMRCQYCGYIHEGPGEAPYVCPVCQALGAFEKAVVAN